MPVVTHMPPQTREGICPVEEQLFGMYTTHMHCIAFKLSVGKNEEERKYEERRLTKLKFSCLVFSNLIKVSRTNRVDVALEKM